jgi:1,4-alpha-glucan branching enzyme
MTFLCEPDSEAKRVFLAGDFNGWDPATSRMTKRNGAFRKRMQLDPGEHQYKFVVDGEWQTDPAAMAQVPNNMGSMNSVVTV